MRLVIDSATDSGAEVLDLWVNDTNRPALRLYRRAGFTDTGTSQPLPSNPQFGETLLSLKLG